MQVLSVAVGVNLQYRRRLTLELEVVLATNVAEGLRGLEASSELEYIVDEDRLIGFHEMGVSTIDLVD